MKRTSFQLKVEGVKIALEAANPGSDIGVHGNVDAQRFRIAERDQERCLQLDNTYIAETSLEHLLEAIARYHLLRLRDPGWLLSRWVALGSDGSRALHDAAGPR